MTRLTPSFAIRLARSREDVEAAQALRYRVFVEEMGAAPGPGCDGARREWDRHDAACEHLILTDALRGDAVVGVTRLMDEAGAARSGGFASEAEFDIGPLLRSGRRVLEVGRSCLHPDYRAGTATHLLWQALAGLAAERKVGLVFGLASLRGTDPAAVAAPLALLQAEHLAPPDLRPVSRAPVAPGPVGDRMAATLALPALVKGYLRLGGKVGEGAYWDEAFGCADVCMVIDASRPGPGASRLAGVLG